MKVYPFKIPKPIKERLIVQVDKELVFYNRLHQHEEIQISYLVKGIGKVFVADSVHPYEAGELFVIGANTPHLFQSIESTTESHMVSLFFTRNTFGKDFFDYPELDLLAAFFVKSERGFKLISPNSAVEEIMQNLENADKFSRFLNFLKLLKIIGQSESVPLSNFTYHKDLSNSEGERMQTIFNHVTKNFQTDIRLKEVSQLVFMTPNAFCRYFKQHTNKTFFQFIIELRIAHACQLIRSEPDSSFAQIAEKSGFNSISNFNRKFRELKQMTPSQYFNQRKSLFFLP